MILSVAVIVLLAMGFHALQNSGNIKGGSVPVAKTAWLFTVLFYWFVLPAIFCADKSLSKTVRMMFFIVLFNMILRAVFELPMMYVTQTWLHVYGIGHDIFSLVLCLLTGSVLVSSLAKTHGAEMPGWLSEYFFFSAFLFMIEAVFASYLRSATNANGNIFFLPDDPSHQFMLVVTAVVVVLTWSMILYLVRQWHEQHA